MCHAAKKAGAPHREYVYRKKQSMIFTHTYVALCSLFELESFLYYIQFPSTFNTSTYQISARLPKVIVKYEPSKFGLIYSVFSLFRGLRLFPLYSLQKSHYKMKSTPQCSRNLVLFKNVLWYNYVLSLVKL